MKTINSNQDPTENIWSVWLRRALWLGIIQDFVLALPAVFWPEKVLALLGQPPASDPIYVSFAAAVLLVLGTMYIPAAVNPYKFPLVAFFSVMARPPGIIFFFFLYPNTYPVFGWVDTVLTAIQVPLLYMAFCGKPCPNENMRPSLDPKAQSPLEYKGTSFQHLRSVVWSDPYQGKLPYNLGLGPLKLISFFNDSARNLADKRDLLPYFNKLIHANGICHTGVWEITEDSPYTGYFAKGSKGLILARLSVAGLTLSPWTRRAFGIAGKIFPTMDPNEVVYPANFVTVSHLSGVRTKHVVDIEMSNAPSVGLDPVVNVVNRIIFRLMDTRPGWRQLHPISTLGLSSGAEARTPDLMMLKIAEDTPRTYAKDFREELRTKHYAGTGLRFLIFVRNRGESAWNQIGQITFKEDVVSESGDKRLHFWIPRDLPTKKG